MCVEKELKNGWIMDHGSNPKPALTCCTPRESRDRSEAIRKATF